jgi:hypothetical protein
MRDVIVLVGLLMGFASLVTVHVAIVFGLAFREPKWRALVALVVPPIAPYWALRGGMRVRAGIWMGSVLLYGLALAYGTLAA